MSEFRPNRRRSAVFTRNTERTLARARELRGAMSPPERKLWVRLRRRQLRGLRFRRQHPIGVYILDFYCDEARIAVELDGALHAESREHDARRDAWLHSQGVEVLRITVSSFERNIGAVLDRIAAAALARLPSSPSGGGAAVLGGGGGFVSTSPSKPRASEAHVRTEPK